MRPTVLLFDLDGTLVNTGGAGRRAMAAAAATIGVPDVFDGFSFAGMTDRAIARYALGRLREEVTLARIEAFLEVYVARLEEELPRATGYVVLPGVAELVQALRAYRHLAVGLGTGNLKRGAYAKLQRAELGSAFAFGGFGCDAEDRTELLRAGAERGGAALGRPLAECRVVVIGDTPKDVAAARGLGAECVAVATGGFTTAELGACGAEHVFEDLADPRVHALLCDGTPVRSGRAP